MPRAPLLALAALAALAAGACVPQIPLAAPDQAAPDDAEPATALGADCAQGDAATGEGADRLMPLTPGSCWVFDWTDPRGERAPLTKVVHIDRDGAEIPVTTARCDDEKRARTGIREIRDQSDGVTQIEWMSEDADHAVWWEEELGADGRITVYCPRKLRVPSDAMLEQMRRDGSWSMEIGVVTASAEASFSCGGCGGCGGGPPPPPPPPPMATPPTPLAGRGDCAAPFRFGLCACGDVDVDARLDVATFASDVTRQAAFGVNGALRATMPFAVDGSLFVDRELTMSALAPSVVRGDLAVFSSAHGAGLLAEGDGYSGASLSGVHIAQDLFAADPAAAGSAVVDGSVLASTVPTVVPCPCAGVSRIPVPAVVAFVMHDDAVALVDGAALVTGAVALPAGVSAAGEVAAPALSLLVSGTSVLVVDGVFDVDDLDVDLAPGASLDVFVAGDLRVGASTSVAHPAALRFFVAGQADVGALFSGLVYAPDADVTLAGGLLTGALLARTIHVAGDTTVRVDRDIVDATDWCPAHGLSALDTPPDLGVAYDEFPDRPAIGGSWQRLDSWSLIGEHEDLTVDGTQFHDVVHVRRALLDESDPSAPAFVSEFWWKRGVGKLRERTRYVENEDLRAFRIAPAP